MLDLFGNIHCTKGHEDKCERAKSEKCDCDCGGRNHGIKNVKKEKTIPQKMTHEINYWLISDTHFNHLKLEEWGMRSGDWQDRLWAFLVNIPEKDILIHLGDVCIGEDGEVHKKIAALRVHKKILIRGNHDKKSLNWYQSHGWDFVCDGLELEYRGHNIHLSHRPSRPQEKKTLNIHGHTHGNDHRGEEHAEFYSKAYHIDISPELVGFQPLRLDQLLKNK